MNRIASLLVGIIFLASNLFAVDRNVDGTGAIAGSFPTISAAITAAVDGDRIIIYDQGYAYGENLTINKTLTFMSSTPENQFLVEGTVSIAPAPGREVSLIGLFTRSLVGGTGNNTAGARCVVNLVDCELTGDIDFDFDNFSMNLLYSVIDGDVEFRHGNVIGNDMGKIEALTADARSSRIFVYDESAAFGVGDTVKIIANYIHYPGQYLINFQNSSARYLIANNMMHNGYELTSSSSYRYILSVTNCYLPDSSNAYLNNTVYVSSSITSCGTASPTDYSVILQGVRDENVTGNFFVDRRSSSSDGCFLYGVNGMYNAFFGSRTGTGYRSAGYQNVYISDLSLYTYDKTTGIISAGNGIDAGRPGIQTLDLDLTRNDQGTGGGPYSWYNYHPVEGSGTGRARVWDLDIQNAIHSLTAPASVKGNSTHMK